MRFRVRYLDGTEVEVVSTASALRAFEREHDQSLLEAMGTYRSYWGDFLAHHSLCQTTDEARPLDEWLDAVEWIRYQASTSQLVELAERLGIHLTEDGDAASPTGRAAKGRSPAGSSKPRSTRAKTSKA